MVRIRDLEEGRGVGADQIGEPDPGCGLGEGDDPPHDPVGGTTPFFLAVAGSAANEEAEQEGDTRRGGKDVDGLVPDRGTEPSDRIHLPSDTETVLLEGVPEGGENRD